MISRRSFLSTLLCLPAATLIPKLATRCAVTGPKMVVTPNTEIFWRNSVAYTGSAITEEKLELVRQLLKKAIEDHHRYLANLCYGTLSAI